MTTLTENNLVPQVKEELFNLTEISLKHGNFESNDNSIRSNKQNKYFYFFLYGKVGILCSFLKKLPGSTLVLILTNLLKFS
jgi:hypothetical protein